MTDYAVLDSGLYEIKRAEVLYRKVGSQAWHQFGDVDSFTLNISPTKVSRYRKNARVRTKAVEVVNQVDSTIKFSCYQFSQFVRAVSVLGEATPLTQAAVDQGTYDIESLKIGDLHYLEKLDISNVSMTDGTAAAWTAGTHFKVVDGDLGVIQILALPDGVAEGDTATVTFDAAAIDETQGRISAAVASQTEIKCELMVRDVGRNSQPKVFRIFECNLAPDGDVAFIDADDFGSVGISGSAVDTNNGVGVVMDLAA